VIDASGSKSGGREVKKALNDINQSVKRTAASFNNLARVAKIALSGMAARAVWRAVIGGAARAESQFARLQGIINATGGAAGKSVEDIAKISREIGRQTLASTQEVRDAAGVLLTFKNVAGDVFDDTLGLAQDLAEAGFGNLRTNAVQLGKALNDPVKGLDGLSRAGVQFTDAQKDQIKALVKSGDLLAAQQLVVKELSSQFGGAGAAAAQGYAGALDTAGEAAKELAEEVGGKLLPALTAGLKAATVGIDFLTQNSDALLGAVAGLATVGIPLLIKGLGLLRVAVLANPIFALATAAVAIGAAIGKLLGITVTFGNTSVTVFDLVKTVIGDVVGVIGSVWEAAKTLFSGFVEGAKAILGSAKEAFGGFGSIAKSVVNFVIAVGKSFADAWIGYFKAIWEAAKGAFQGISNAAASVGSSVKLALKGEFAAAKEELSGAFDGFNFDGVTASLGDTAKTIGANFGRDFVGEAGGAIESFLDNTVGDYADSVIDRTVDKIANSPGDTAKAIVAPTFDPEASGGGSKGGASKAPTKSLKDKIDEVKSLKEQLIDLGKEAQTAGDIMAEGIGSAIDGLSDAFVDFAKTGKFNFRDLASDIFSQLTKLAANSLLKQLIGGFGGLGGGGGFLGGLLGFAQGGDFTVGGGGGTDSKLVAFKASPGERVSVRRPDQADGGGAAPNVTVINKTDPGELLDAIGTTAGERTILNVIERNPAAIQGMLSR
jgi:hypothetical protein